MAEEKELAQGLKDLAAESALNEAVAGAAMPPEEAAWAPSMDWVMNSVGPFFNNNQGLGELLLDKLTESGINTEGVALAGLVNILQQFSQEYKALGEAVGNNLDRINDLSDKSDNLAEAIQDVLKEMNVSKDAGGENPMGSDVGDIADTALAGSMPDMGGDMAPPDMTAAPPPDMGAPDVGAAPAGADASGAAPQDTAGAAPDTAAPPPNGAPLPEDQAVSDKNLKNVKKRSTREIVGILSDYRMKHLTKRIANHYKNHTRMNPNILDACKGDFS